MMRRLELPAVVRHAAQTGSPRMGMLHGALEPFDETLPVIRFLSTLGVPGLRLQLDAGAPAETRTRNQRIRSPLLYPLSYRGLP